jgi:hypothetical protein
MTRPMPAPTFRLVPGNEESDPLHILVPSDGTPARWAVQDASAWSDGFCVLEYGPSIAALEWVHEHGTHRTLRLAKRACRRLAEKAGVR